jgi:FkbM family methyltransferase
MKIMFDVGAHKGGETRRRKYYPWWSVHAFEPIPELALGLPAGPRYKVNVTAVSEHDGMADFQVDDFYPELSSLLPFNPGVPAAYGTPMRVTRVIHVPTIRLDTYIKENGIPRIDDLHIDTQGGDLEVIRSLGDMLSIVKNIKCEAMIRPMYIGQSDREAILQYVVPRGFVLKKIKTLEDNTGEDLFLTRRFPV